MKVLLVVGIDYIHTGLEQFTNFLFAFCPSVHCSHFRNLKIPPVSLKYLTYTIKGPSFHPSQIIDYIYRGYEKNLSISDKQNHNFSINHEKLEVMTNLKITIFFLKFIIILTGP